MLIYDEVDIGAAAAGHLAGVPAVAHSLGRQLSDPIRRAALERLTQVVRGYGLDPPPGDLFEANAYLDICPPSLQHTSQAEPAERIPLRPVAPIGPTDGLLGIESARSRPLVYLTLGTYVSGRVGSLRAAAAGLGTLDVDALVTVGPDGDPAALGPLPGSVRVERFVTQGLLLPHVYVVAHLGGSGTMLGALARGLPQLTLPNGADQFMNAQALLDSGASLRLLPEQITSESAAMPAPAETVSKLERLAAK